MAKPGVYEKGGKWAAYADVRGQGRYVGRYGSQGEAEAACKRFEVLGAGASDGPGLMESVSVDGGKARVKVDRDDFRKVAGMMWREVDGVVCCVVDGVMLTMGQVLFGERGKIEFRNGNVLDFRKSNVVVGGHQGLDRKTPKLKGVAINRNSKTGQVKYLAQVAINRKVYTLGVRDTPEEAHQLYLEKAEAKRREVLAASAGVE